MWLLLLLLLLLLLRYQLFSSPFLQQINLPEILKAKHSASEDASDPLADFLLETERNDGDEDHKEEADAVLDQQEREVVQEVDLGHVHVQGVRRDERQREADDDPPAPAAVIVIVITVMLLLRGDANPVKRRRRV